MNTYRTTRQSDKRSGFTPSLLTILLAFILSSPLSAQQAMKPVNWDAYRFLLGEWVGEGSGNPGQGSGGFTFSFDLQNAILVRKNFADYPATKDRPAFSHNDLMVVYQENGTAKAIYFDNEQHVIHYTVSLSGDSSSVIFLSDVNTATPRYRLTNARTGTESMKIVFEIAPPGKPESFTRYIEATARRKQ